jgi:general secretion pathway protein J
MNAKSQNERTLRAADNAGFTLMEMLVAMALMGLVLSALATITAQWVPNWHRGFERVQRSEMLDIALSRLASDVGAAEFVTANRKAMNPVFDGAELAVTFVRTALGPNTRPSLELVRISQTSDRLGSIVTRSRAPFVPTDPDAPQSLPVVFADQVALLRGPYRLAFAYADRDGAWRDRWLDEKEMPTSVRFILRDAVSERNLAVSTATIVRVDTPAECVHPKGERDCGRPAGAGPDNGDAGGSKQNARTGG